MTDETAEIQRNPVAEGYAQHSSPQRNSTLNPSTSGEIDDVFSLFKTYLENRLDQKGQELAAKQKINLQAENFKFKGDQKQFVFNAELEELVGRIGESNASRSQESDTINRAGQIAVAQEAETDQACRF